MGESHPLDAQTEPRGQNIESLRAGICSISASFATWGEQPLSHTSTVTKLCPITGLESVASSTVDWSLEISGPKWVGANFQVFYQAFVLAMNEDTN